MRSGNTVFLVMATLVSAGAANRSEATGPPDVDRSGVYFTPHLVASISLHCNPDGTGRRLDQAQVRNVGPVPPIADATVLVTIKDSDGAWVMNYPAADIWLEALQGGIARCPSHPAIADGPTGYFRFPPLDPDNPLPPDYEWSTKFSAAYAVGGHTDPLAGDRVVFLTAATGSTPLPGLDGAANLQFNSPDISGDGVTNLLDIVLFANDYFGSYDYRSDFLPDGQINLSDVALMAQGYGRYCP